MTIPAEQRARRLPFGFTALDENVRRDVIYIDASDTAPSMAVLYRPSAGEPRTAVYLMHPRGDFSRHYAVPGLVANGFAVFCHNSRYLNNDTDMVHERLLLDIAAGMRWLKERGHERVVLLGNSGGGSLFSFYQSQAERAPEERISVTPGSEAIPLAAETMPAGDAFVVVAAHPGQGQFMLGVLDPSVIDESDPESCDTDWDMYNPANGYRPYPEPSHYDPDWLAEYRRRQVERCRRLDATAREILTEAAFYRAEARAEGFAGLPAEAQDMVRRRARLGRYMVVYRTLANPAYLDPSIDPNERRLGSIFSPGDTIIGNYGYGGLGRLMTPRGWLSTWSGLSSNANFLDTVKGVSVPTVIVYPTGDSDIYPSAQQQFLANSGAADKSLVELPGADHYLYPVGDAGLADPRERVIDIVAPWIKERLGAG